MSFLVPCGGLLAAFTVLLLSFVIIFLANKMIMMKRMRSMIFLSSQDAHVQIRHT